MTDNDKPEGAGGVPRYDAKAVFDAAAPYIKKLEADLARVTAERNIARHDAEKLVKWTASAMEEAARLRGALEFYRPEVRAFACVMEEKLRENDHRTGWKDEPTDYLLGRPREELVELQNAVKAATVGKASALDVCRESADVANMAMMVADVCGGLDIKALEEKTDE